MAWGDVKCGDVLGRLQKGQPGMQGAKGIIRVQQSNNWSGTLAGLELGDGRLTNSLAQRAALHSIRVQHAHAERGVAGTGTPACGIAPGDAWHVRVLLLRSSRASGATSNESHAESGGITNGGRPSPTSLAAAVSNAPRRLSKVRKASNVSRRRAWACRAGSPRQRGGSRSQPLGAGAARGLRRLRERHRR